MKKMFAIFLTSLCLSQGLKAEELKQSLLAASNEEDSDITEVVVTLNEQFDITSFYKLSSTGVRTDYALENVAAGFVLDRRSLRDVVVLSSDNFAAHQGGDLKLTYLYDGRPHKNEYRTLMLRLERLGNDWQVTHDGKVVGSLLFKSRRVSMLGLIGIAEIVVTYK